MSEKSSENNMENLIMQLEKVLKLKSGDPVGSTYQSLRKLYAKCLLEKNKNLEAAFNLTEALAPSVRTMATYRVDRNYCFNEKKTKLEVCSSNLNAKFKKISQRDDNKSDNLISYLSEKNCANNRQDESISAVSKESHLNKEFIKHVDSNSEEISKFCEKIKELPDEWTVIQLTAGYEPCEQWQSLRVVKSSVKYFYLTILKSDCLSEENIETFTVQIVPENLKYGEKGLFEELYSTVEENLHVIENNLRVTNNSLEKYWEKRGDCDLRMKSVISSMDKKWLGAWRCILSGQIISKELKQSIRLLINNFCSNNNVNLTSIQKMLLFKLLSAAHSISPTESSLFLRKIYTLYAKPIDGDTCTQCNSNIKINALCNNCDIRLISSSYEYKLFKKTFTDILDNIKADKELKGLKNARRNPLILFIDEKLDTFPWEVLPILSNHPVTRLECFTMAHALYKKHEKNISNGYYQLKPTVGRYLINPGGDLRHMEKRMGSFMDYWCPQWQGEKNSKASQDLYEKYLCESDIFLYCGHGDGSQYISSSAERLVDVKSIAVLSGCGSVALRHPGPRMLPIPIHSHFHIANSPSIIGMLWEVTDLEVDKVTSMLIGLFMPSEARKHWGYVDKTQWTKGIIGPGAVEESGKFNWESDLLRALCIARRSSSYVMIAASIVARGLPVLINPDYHSSQ